MQKYNFSLVNKFKKHRKYPALALSVSCQTGTCKSSFVEDKLVSDSKYNRKFSFSIFMFDTQVHVNFPEFVFSCPLNGLSLFATHRS